MRKNLFDDKTVDECIEFCLLKAASDIENKNYYLSIAKKLVKCTDWSGPLTWTYTNQDLNRQYNPVAVPETSPNYSRTDIYCGQNTETATLASTLNNEGTIES